MPAGPTPVFGRGVPRKSWYVLDGRDTMALYPVADSAALERDWPGAFAAPPVPRRGVWDTIQDGLHRPARWHIAMVLILWLLLALLIAWWLLSGHQLS